MKSIDKYAYLISRIFICFIFLLSGINKIRDFSGTKQFMISKHIPLPLLFLILAIILELTGSFSVLLGYKAKFGASLLIIFLIPATLIFHTNFSDQTQLLNFLKNLAILGGLMAITIHGAGPLSLDQSQTKKKL